ncbi:MAG TPA: GlsB/YeaQ/YmgE family stress response membrane protein [Coleofasciculaceae cyanobacterium]
MNILAWIVLGLIAGAIAKAVYPGYQSGGILGTMILGIIGAFVGGSLYTLLTTGTLALTATGLSIGGIFIAVIGAIIALWIYYAIGRRSAI